MAPDESNRLWTLGIWSAKAGRGDEFKAVWQAFADWTCRNQPGASDAFLLRDAQNADRFVSFGPWETPEAAAAWRNLPEFAAFVSKVRELCDDFQPNTLLEVAHVKSLS